MRFFVKAIATGFAMSMGSALFKQVSKKMGFEDEAKEEEKTKKNAVASENTSSESEAEPEPT